MRLYRETNHGAQATDSELRLAKNCNPLVDGSSCAGRWIQKGDEKFLRALVFQAATAKELSHPE